MNCSASLFSPLYVANTFWWQANQSTTTSNNMCILQGKCEIRHITYMCLLLYWWILSVWKLSHGNMIWYQLVGMIRQLRRTQLWFSVKFLWIWCQVIAAHLNPSFLQRFLDAMWGEGREEKREKRWQIRDDLGRGRHCGRGCNIFWFLVQQQNNPSNQAWDEGPIKKWLAPS